MPAQALIREMNKAKVDELVASGKATELLEVEESDGAVLVRCKAGPGGVGNLPGAHAALQAICDEDSKIVRANAKARADKEAADKAAKEKITITAADVATVPASVLAPKP